MTLNTARFHLESLTVRWVSIDVAVIQHKKKLERCKPHDWLELFSLTAPLTCAAVGRPEDQAGKCFTCHESAQVSRTSMHSSLFWCSWQHEDDVMLSARRPSFILTQERRSSCHFECQVRPQMKIFVPKLFEVSPSFCQRVSYTDSHFSACAGYVPFGTPIVSPHMKSHTFLFVMHFIEVNLAVQTPIYMVVVGDRWNETRDLFCPRNKFLFPGLI